MKGGRPRLAFVGRGRLFRTAFSALAAAFLPAACEPEAGSQAAPSELARVSADEVTYDITHFVSVGGVREAVLRADSMLAWRDSSHVALGQLELSIFDEQGRSRATITADHGRLHPQTNELTAMGNARLRVPSEDLEIIGAELRFAPESDRIWSDSAVVMRREQCEAQGDGFEADLSFDDVRIGRTREQGCAGQ